jgi:type I restriction enzyme, S subunit
MINIKLGDVMKNGWEISKLGEVCQVDKSQGSHKNLPYVGMENIESNTARFIGSTEPQSVKSSTFKFTNNHLLYGRLRPYLNKVIVPEFEGHCSTEVFPIKPSKNLDRYFLLYWFLMDSTVMRINATCTGARMPRANMNSVLEFEFLLPPLSEQKRIVSIVDEAFEAIDIAIDNTKQNLTNARELFDSYLNAIFTQKGDGWEKNTLEDICSITSKLVEPRQPEFIDLPHVGAGNMTYLTGELIDVKTAREENLISGKFLFDETMVLYSKIRPYLMKACRPNFQGLCSADVYPLLPNYEILNRDFLFHLLMSKNFTNYAIAGSDRAGMPKVNRDHLFRYITWIPSLSEQIDITKKIDRLAIETQRIEAIYRQKLTALNELKQSILHKAFTGELTADKADLMTNIEREAICT